MEDHASGLFMLSALQIILIDLVLSGDNAVVIAMAARNLDRRNRKRAFVFGAMGAMLLRIFFAGVTSTALVKVPVLQPLGGVALLWIAVKLLSESGGDITVEPQKRLVSAIKTIILADLIMSLDNVLAVGGAAHGNTVLLIAGLVLSMTMLMLGSQALSSIMSRSGLVTNIGAGVIAWVAGDMICSERTIKLFFSSHANFFIPAFSMMAVFLAAEVIQAKSR